MEQVRIDDLSARLEKLERENRIWRRASACLLLIAASILGLAFQSKEKDKSASRSMQVNRLTFVDGDGKSCGWLSVRKDGIGLAFGDKDGAKSGLVLNADGGGIKYFKDGNALAGLAVQANGVATGVKGDGETVSSGLNALVNGIGNSLAAEQVFKAPTKQR